MNRKEKKCLCQAPPGTRWCVVQLDPSCEPPRLCNVPEQLLVSALPPPPAARGSEQSRDGCVPGCVAGRLNHSPSALCGRRAAAWCTSGEEVTAGDATGAGKGCDGMRAAIKGSVKEMTLEKAFEKQRR